VHNTSIICVLFMSHSALMVLLFGRGTNLTSPECADRRAAFLPCQRRNVEACSSKYKVPYKKGYSADPKVRQCNGTGRAAAGGGRRSPDAAQRAARRKPRARARARRRATAPSSDSESEAGPPSQAASGRCQVARCLRLQHASGPLSGGAATGAGTAGCGPTTSSKWQAGHATPWS
jgi:hypothetical protein